jgi:hypothetical protein
VASAIHQSLTEGFCVFNLYGSTEVAGDATGLAFIANTTSTAPGLPGPLSDPETIRVSRVPLDQIAAFWYSAEDGSVFHRPLDPDEAAAAHAPAGRGLHSSTYQLSPSRFWSHITQNTSNVSLKKCSRSVGEWRSVRPWPTGASCHSPA